MVNLRLRFTLIALALMFIGTLPIWLLYAGFTAGGGLGFLAFVGGLLLSPMLLLCVAGWKFLVAIQNHRELVVMGRRWGDHPSYRAQQETDDVLDAKFEDE